MNDFTTMIIFLGITFTLVGSCGSLIVLSMIFITRLRERCRRTPELEDEEMKYLKI